MNKQPIENLAKLINALDQRNMGMQTLENIFNNVLTFKQTDYIESYLRSSPFLDQQFHFGNSSGGQYLEEYINILSFISEWKRDNPNKKIEEEFSGVK